MTSATSTPTAITLTTVRIGRRRTLFTISCRIIVVFP
jgi:hypothetical protein